MRKRAGEKYWKNGSRAGCVSLLLVLILTALCFTGCGAAGDSGMGQGAANGQGQVQGSGAGQEATQGSGAGQEQAQENSQPAAEAQAQPLSALEPAVTVISGEETYIPIADFTFEERVVADPQTGEEQVVSANGGYLQIQDVRGMTKVPYDPQMRIQASRQPKDIWYGLFAEAGQALNEGDQVLGEAGKALDEQRQAQGQQAQTPGGGTEEVSSLEEIKLPEPEDGYVVKLGLTYESEGGVTGYQYFFQVTKEGPAASLSLVWDKEDNAKEIAAQKGGGVFPALVQNDRAAWLPLGTSLELSFSPEASLEEIRVYDLLLDSRGNCAEYFDGEEFENAGIDLDPALRQYRLDVNLRALKAGYPEAYQGGGVIRGLLFWCRFEDGREEWYSAAVRTDSVYGLNGSVLEEVSGASLEFPEETQDQVVMGAKPQRKGEGVLLELTLENRGDREYLYGVKPILRRHNGETFEEVPMLENTGWNDIGYILHPEGKKDFTVDLEALYGTLRPGYYCFCKELTDSDSGERIEAGAGFVVAF